MALKKSQLYNSLWSGCDELRGGMDALVHLLERHHTVRFRALMDRFMPAWRLYREELNQAPLVHEDWSY